MARRRLCLTAAIEMVEMEPRVLFCAGGSDYTVLPPITNWKSTFIPNGATVVDNNGASTPAAAGSPLSSVPVLNSDPGAPATLYLDFVGAAAQTWGSYNVPFTPAFDRDGDATTFSDAELDAIREIFARVSEAYSPFNLNVTTVDPGNLNDRQTLKVVVGGTGGWLGQSAGGVSYVGSFANSAPNVAFAFANLPGYSVNKYVADVIEHESGHGFGLQHQSQYSGTTKTNEYRQGDSLVAPIMGVSYYATRGKWSNGQSSLGYNITQDDMAVIAGSANGFGYRTDDHGNTIGAADPLDISGADASGSGLIATTTDVDVFSFYTLDGTVNFSVNVAQFGATLDATLQLVDANGNVIATANTSSLSESVSASVVAGSYRLIVSSKGTYGDVGQYTISGTIVPSANYVAAPSTAVAANSSGSVSVTWHDNSWNETSFSIERSDDGGSTWNVIGSADANAHAYVDSTVSVGHSYLYRVCAYNGADQSNYSNSPAVSVVPANPASLSAISISASRIDLTWSDVSGESGYIIERSTNGTTWTQVGTTGADTTTYSDTGLVAGTRYFYRVKASTAVGNSGASNTADATTRPAQPAITLTVISSGQINVIWTNVLGETGYRIERSLNGSDWTTIYTAAANVAGYANVGLSGSTTYYYRVTAYNAGGDSTSSTASTVTLVGAPSAPTITNVTTNEIDLSWIDATGETGYRVERSLDERTWTLIATVGADTTTYANTGLVAGTRYLYRIRAINAGGISAASTSASAFTIPSAPTLTGKAASDVSALLSWSNVAGETNYVLQRSDNGTDGWSTIASPLANVISFTNTGLASDTDYYFRVIAHNASGDSACSSTVAVHTLLPAVGGLNATGFSTSQIDLTWTDSVGETGYRVERFVSGTTWILVTTTAADTTTFSDTGLAAGSVYYYRVRAVNAGGNSLVTETKSAITLPAAATLTVTTLSATQLRLSWLNILGESGYRIERSDDGVSGWNILATTAANAITYIDSGLSSNTQYFYRVTPFNISGDGAASTVKSRYTLLPAPTDLSAHATSTSQIDLTWSDSDGESGYVIERSLNGGLTWSALATLGADVTTYSNTGLVAGGTYTYRVRATNAGGNSEPALKATATTIPPAVAISAGRYANRITLAWTNVAGETGYRIESSTDGGSTWSAPVTTLANITSYAFSNLSANTAYTFRVTAYNAAGDATGTVATFYTLLPAPTGVSATAPSSTSVQLSWSDSDGESGYKIERYTGTAWAVIATVAADVTSYLNTGLLAGRAYYYRVRAINAGGVSEPSLIASIVTPAASRIVHGARPPGSAFQITRLIAEILHAA